jgi:hypothetical protein
MRPVRVADRVDVRSLGCSECIPCLTDQQFRMDQTMKTIIAAFSFLLVSTVILSNSQLGYGAASEGTISARQFAGNCANAVLHREGANGLVFVQTLHINGNEK